MLENKRDCPKLTSIEIEVGSSILSGVNDLKSENSVHRFNDIARWSHFTVLTSFDRCFIEIDLQMQCKFCNN